MGRPIAIAIDGPASSGKGTVARMVAAALDYTYIDTGALYRAVGLLALRAGLPLDDGAALCARVIAVSQFALRWEGGALEVLANGERLTQAIRAEAVGQAASMVAAQPAVREALLQVQRALGEAGGVVMDGRDIGTVILPNAELKVFLDASVEVRAQRRHLELTQKGTPLPYAQVLADLRVRDERDSQRAAAPLRAADDAVRIDSSGLTPQEVADRVVALARQRGA